MQHEHDKQQGTSKDESKFQRRHRRQLSERKHAESGLASEVSNHPRLGPYPYDPVLSAAAAAFNQRLSTQAHQAIDQGLVDPGLSSHNMSVATALGQEFRRSNINHMIQQRNEERVSTRLNQLLKDQESDRIFRIAHGLPPALQVEGKTASTLPHMFPSSSFVAGGLDNHALSGQNSVPISAAHAPTQVSEPVITSRFLNQQRADFPTVLQAAARLLLPSNQEDSPKCKNYVMTKPSNRKIKHRERRTKKQKRNLDMNDKRSEFPLPALEDTKIPVTRAIFKIFNQFWDSIPADDALIRREVFLKNLRLKRIR